MTAPAKKPLEERTQKRRSRGWKIPRVILMGTLSAWLVVLLAGLLMVMALYAGWLPDTMKGLIELVFRETLQRELQISAVEGSLDDVLVLRGLAIMEPGALPDETTALTLQSLELDFDLRRSLTRRQIVIRSVVLDTPRVVVSRGASTLWKVIGLGELGSAGGGEVVPPDIPIAIDLRRLEIQSGHIELSADIRTGIEQLEAHVDALLERFVWRPGEPPHWPAQGEIELAVASLGWRGRSIGSGRAHILSKGARAKVQELTLEGPMGGLAGTAELKFADAFFKIRLAETKARLALRGVDIARFGPDGEPLGPVSSSLNGELTLRLASPVGQRLIQPKIDVDLTLGPSQLAQGDLNGGALKGRFQVGSNRWLISEARLETAAGTLTARGHGSGRDMGELELHGVDLDLAAVPRSWGPVHPAAGVASLDLVMSGPFGDPTGQAHLWGEGLRVEELGPARFDIELGAAGNGIFRVESFEASVAASARRWAGAFARTTQTAKLQFGQATIRFEDLELIWSGGALTASGGLETAPASTGAGTRLLPTHVGVEALDLAVLADLLGSGNEVAGELSGSFDLDGEMARPSVVGSAIWSDPELLGLSAERAEVSLIAEGERIELSAAVTRDGRPELALAVNLPRDAGRDTRSSGLGTMLRDPAFELDLTTHDFDLAWLEPLSASLPELLGATPRGVLNGRVVARGGTPYPRIDGSLELREVLVVAGESAGAPKTPQTESTASTKPLPRLGPCSGTIDFEGNAARIAALHVGEGDHEILVASDLVWHDASRELDFDASIEGVGFRGRMEISGGIHDAVLRPSIMSFFGFEASELARLTGIEIDLGGRLSAEVELVGPLRYPDLQLRAAWEEPSVAGRTSDRVVAQAATDDQGLAMTGAFLRKGNREITVEAHLPLVRPIPDESGDSLLTQLMDTQRWLRDPNSRLAIKANQFDLHWLALLVPQLPLRSQGVVNGDVIVKGAEPIPLLEGVVNLEHGVFAIADQRASVGPLDGRVEFKGTQAQLDHLLFRTSKGRAELTGTLAWGEGGVEQLDVDVLFENYLFNQLGLLRTYVDGKLEAKGPLEMLDVTGALKLRDVRVSFPTRDDPVLKEIRVMGLPQESETASIYEGEADIAGIDAQTRLNVEVELPETTWVRGMGLNARIAGRVQITKERQEELRYSGTLEVEEGRYTLQGKRFELERGVAMFAGETTPIPDVDIVGIRDTDGVRVTAHLTGPASEPKLELTSDPPLDSAEIIALIFFGRSRYSNNDQTFDADGISTAAASVAGVMLVDNIAPELRENLRIDQISVTSGEGDEAPSVEIESQLTPTVYLRLIQSFGTSAEEAVEVRWRFWKGFTFKSKVKRSGASSIDLLWQFDYWGLERWGLGGLRAAAPPYRANASARCVPPALCPSDGQEAAPETGGE